MDAAITLRGVEKNYEDFALQGIDLELPAGQIMGLVGANGAGKSTIMRILVGLLAADAGEITVCGLNPLHDQAAVKREIGYASEDMRLYKSQTLRWHMDFIHSIYPRWDEAYAGELLERFDLRAHQALRGFSHGQRVKALLLLVLARRPRLLLLDEPTTGLDPIARSEVLDALAEVMRDDDRSVLFSSHNTKDVEQLSDSITFVHKGKLIASQDKESFLDHWRRVVAHGTWQEAIRAIDGVATARNNGSVIELKVNRFEERVVTELKQLGLAVTTVEPMSLEDIFVTSVRAGASQ